MVRHFLLGTAGHVDHGKTSLIKVLTGTDTDRLPEEKRRGLTVDLGFAAIEYEDLLLGVVDVPGHERFVKNMLAGATGIDLALLVVAADEGVMLQTTEHFEVLRHLQVQAGAIAITKSDLVDQDMISLVREDVTSLVAGTFLQDAHILEVSSKTGSGIDNLRCTLANVAKDLPVRKLQGQFKMPIDRCFTAPGHGTIVTGSVASGEVACGEKLHVFPDSKVVTVRSIEGHGQSLPRAGRGQRAALNLAGVHYTELQRGNILATPGSIASSKILSIDFQASPVSSRILKPRTKVRFYSGTSETVGLLRLPSELLTSSGESQVGQLLLKETVSTTWGEAFVIRSLTENHVIGGGRIIDPAAPRINFRDKEKQAHLTMLQDGSDTERIAALSALSGTLPWTKEELSLRSGAADCKSELKDLELQGVLYRFELKSNSRWLHRDTVNQLQKRLLESVKKEHDKNPARSTIPFSKIRSYFKMIDPPELIDQLANLLRELGQLEFDFSQVALPDWQPVLSEHQKENLSTILDTCNEAALTPPTASELADKLSLELEDVELLLELAVIQGELVRLPDKDSRGAKAARRARLHLHKTAKQFLLEQLGPRLEKHAQWTLSQFCEAFEVSRKYAIPLCGYLDQNGISKRIGDVRVLIQPNPLPEGSNDTTYVG